MQKTKLTILAVCALAGLSLSAASICAQEGLDTGDMVARMSARLRLTEEQTDAVIPIIEEYADGYQRVINGSGQLFSSSRAIRRQVGKLKEERDEKLSHILTPEQMRKLDQGESVKGFLNQDEASGADRTPDTGDSRLGLGSRF
jgi:hypothetical protein